MKKWIKSKLVNFLGIDEVQGSLTRLHNKYNHNNELLKSVQFTNEEVLSRNEYILKQFNLAADINPYGREQSWAIIAINGKPEYVKFVSLSNRDMREIHNFIKRFEGTNRTVDSPYRISDFKWQSKQSFIRK